MTVPCAGAGGGPTGLVAAINRANSSHGGTISLASGCTYTFAAVDNYWYGPNVLPPIASAITIEGDGARLTIDGNLIPSRFFFVAADPAAPVTHGYSSPGAGELTLRHVTLSGGQAKGGGSNSGGGGAGMGGAIFSQGRVTIDSSTMTNDVAQGGSSGVGGSSQTGGGGIGTDANGAIGGGFGGGGYHGASGAAGDNAGYGGGGGGFRATESAPFATGSGDGVAGGADNGMGGKVLSVGGDGAGHGGSQSAGAGGGGGGFGFGGQAGSGGGGAGGGGGGAMMSSGVGGGGGFGGGGGESGGSCDGAYGGFGGGGGAVLGSCSTPVARGGFGGGDGGTAAGGGGAGFGGAVFNMEGTLTIVNSTFTGDDAFGGSGANPGAGAGGAVANLNGTVTVSSSTFSSNIAVAGGTDIASFGYDAARGLSSTVVVRGSIMAPPGLAGEPDIAVNAPQMVGDGSDNLSRNPCAAAPSPCPVESFDVSDHDLIGQSNGPFGDSTLTGVGGTNLSPAMGPDPQLGALSDNGGPTSTMAPGAGSPAIDVGGTSCPAVDQRGVIRPEGPACDIGAVENLAPPAAPALRSTAPSASGSTTSIKVLGTAAAGSIVSLFTNARCTGQPIAAGDADTFASPGIAVTVAPKHTTSFRATATRYGLTSACSSTSVSYTPSTVPKGVGFTLNGISSDGSQIIVMLTPASRGKVVVGATIPGLRSCHRDRHGHPVCRASTIAIGSTHAMVTAGREATLELPINATGLARLRHGALHATVTVTLTTPGGRRTTKGRTVLIAPPRPNSVTYTARTIQLSRAFVRQNLIGISGDGLTFMFKRRTGPLARAHPGSVLLFMGANVVVVVSARSGAQGFIIASTPATIGDVIDAAHVKTRGDIDFTKMFIDRPDRAAAGVARAAAGVPLYTPGYPYVDRRPVARAEDGTTIPIAFSVPVPKNTKGKVNRVGVSIDLTPTHHRLSFDGRICVGHGGTCSNGPSVSASLLVTLRGYVDWDSVASDWQITHGAVKTLKLLWSKMCFHVALGVTASDGDTSDKLLKIPAFAIPLGVDIPLPWTPLGVPMFVRVGLGLLAQLAFTSTNSLANAAYSTDACGTEHTSDSDGSVSGEGNTSGDGHLKFEPSSTPGEFALVLADEVPKLGIGLGITDASPDVPGWKKLIKSNAGAYLDNVFVAGLLTGGQALGQFCTRLQLSDTINAGYFRQFLGLGGEDKTVRPPLYSWPGDRRVKTIYQGFGCNTG